MCSRNLEDTVLWQIFEKKASFDRERCLWVQKIYAAAADYLKDVRITFQNYTLHDEKHIRNVIEAMGGLLGDQIDRLTVGEAELLILAACLHDLGMVYTEEEKGRHYADEDECREFLSQHCPELLGCPAEEWPEDVRQWYLRTLHPFRLPEVLGKKEWSELFSGLPADTVSKQCIMTVCQAHGEQPRELQNNRELEYQPASEVDPLFCALLLRLADLLDFDDTRAPRVLYGYVLNNDKSREEWDKHQASAGFRYPASPSGGDLPYKARCKNPGIEHAVRDFLDWTDDELAHCARLKRYCAPGWRQQFPFPRAVLRDGIESDGYMSGDFCMTMDQAQILKLLTGENLYDNTDVFVRELLQNAIDATLLRGEMDSHFIPEQSRIDFWEWNDKDGYIWFRIDDQGTGMTLGMLQRYFLKVGNSYYNSKELERDLRSHDREGSYEGISRFGIGFLSCFLCGDHVEVSTSYFDPEKNRREEEIYDASRTVRYGLRLQVTGLTGYYMLKNQARQHVPDGPMPSPDCFDAAAQPVPERGGYRAQPGISIAVRLDLGKLGSLDLREAVRKYLCYARVPVYYNGERIGHTYEELMRDAHEMAGETVYELTPGLKAQFDRTFPGCRGRYPRLVLTAVPLDSGEDFVLQGLSGVLIKYELRFDKEPEWKVKDLDFVIKVSFFERNDTVMIRLNSTIVGMYPDEKWRFLKGQYGQRKADALAKELEKYAACPRTEKELGEAWLPFAVHNDLRTIWNAYFLYQQAGEMEFSAAECGCPGRESWNFKNQWKENLIFAYQGVAVEKENLGYGYYEQESCFDVIFLMSGDCKPVVEMSRSRMADLPLQAEVAVCGSLIKYRIPNGLRGFGALFHSWRCAALGEWRKVRSSHTGKWLEENLGGLFSDMKQALQDAENMTEIGIYDFSIGCNGNHNYSIPCKYFMAVLQDDYEMQIEYGEKLRLSFFEKTAEERQEKKKKSGDSMALLPPMLFCRAADDKSRKYLCAREVKERRGITADHPFAIWLLKNTAQLERYYSRHFQQIVQCLCGAFGKDIARVCDDIREQLSALPERHGVDVKGFPVLSADDFWESFSFCNCPPPGWKQSIFDGSLWKGTGLIESYGHNGCKS